MAGCAICSNPIVRKVDRVVRLGYLANFTELVGTVLQRDGAGIHGDNYPIKVCSQCRYDLVGEIRRWLACEWAERKKRRGRKVYDPCPICSDHVTQDCRTLRVAGIPGLEFLHPEFQFEDGVALLTTCQGCRADFIRLLKAWVAGAFIADGRGRRAKDVGRRTRRFARAVVWMS